MADMMPLRQTVRLHDRVDNGHIAVAPHIVLDIVCADGNIKDHGIIGFILLPQLLIGVQFLIVRRKYLNTGSRIYTVEQNHIEHLGVIQEVNAHRSSLAGSGRDVMRFSVEMQRHPGCGRRFQTAADGHSPSLFHGHSLIAILVQQEPIAPRLFIQAGYPVPIFVHSTHLSRNSSGSRSSKSTESVGCGQGFVMPACRMSHSRRLPQGRPFFCRPPRDKLLKVLPEMPPKYRYWQTIQ